MAARSKKPKCDGSTSQSCGMSCISREDTCREMVAADVATRLLSVAKQHQQPNDATGKDFDSVAANFPPKLLKVAHKTGVATSDLGNGATLTTKEAVGLDGSSIKYGFVTDADGKRYTVSDGLVKEVTSAAGSEWDEAFEAAVRSKVAMAGASNTGQGLENVSVASEAVLSNLGETSKPLTKYASKASKAVTAKAALIASVTGEPPGGLGLAVWLTDDYKKISKYTYKSDESLKLEADYSETFSELAKAAALAVAKLPSATAATMNSKNNGSYPPATEGRMQALNRFAYLSKDLLAKYKEGSTVTENGMFGTSYLTEQEFSSFAYGDSTHFIVKSKGFGATAGKAMDQFKSDAFEGEVLFTPGTQFKVTKVIEPVRLQALGADPRAKTNKDVLVAEIVRSDPNAKVGNTTFGKLQEAIQKNDSSFLKTFDSKYSASSGFSPATADTVLSALRPVAKRDLDLGEVLTVDLSKPGVGEEIIKSIKDMAPDKAEDIDLMFKSGLTSKQLEADIAAKGLADLFGVNYMGKLAVGNKLFAKLKNGNRMTVYLEEL